MTATPRTDLAFCWDGFCNAAHDELLNRGYSSQTAKLYSSIARRFGRQLGCSPANLTQQMVSHAVARFAAGHAAGSTTSAIAALRTVLDQTAGFSLTTGITTPKRRYPLPWAPTRQQVSRILANGATLRDQLLLGLLYGTGCRPGEVVRLRWADIDIEKLLIRLPGDRQLKARHLPIPHSLLPLLSQGTRICHPTALIFPGRSATRPLTVRSLEAVVRKAAEPLDLLNRVSATSLRHAFALHALDDGWNVRQLQEALGHRTLRPVMRYQRCTPPDVVSPADTLFDMPALPAIEPASFRLPFTPDDHKENPLVLFRRALRSGIRRLFASRAPD